MSQLNRALVIIDLQNEFLSTDGRYPILKSSKQALFSNLTTLVPGFRKSGHIIWIKSIYDNTGGSSNTSQPADDFDSPASSPTQPSNQRTRNPRLAITHKGKLPCCEAGSTNAELYPTVLALVADSDQILIKTYYSAFRSTTLLSTLRANSIESVYFCGLLSNACVLATLIDAVQIDGLKVHAIGDCLGWRRESSHLSALKKMKDMGVIVVTSNEACAEDANDIGVLHVPELYYVNGSIPSWRVHLALYEKGIEVNQIRMKVMSHPKPTRLPAFLALNHRGKTPVFIDTDKERTTVNESLAILMYIETYYPDTPLLPPLEQRKYRARILSLIQETENLHNAYDALEEAFFDARNSNTTTEFTMTTRPLLLQSLYKELEYWETYASASNGFIGGREEFTLADCAFYPILCYMRRRGFKFEGKWPGLKRYHALVWERWSARMAQPEGWVGIGKTNVFRGT